MPDLDCEEGTIEGGLPLLQAHPPTHMFENLQPSNDRYIYTAMPPFSGKVANSNVSLVTQWVKVMKGFDTAHRAGTVMALFAHGYAFWQVKVRLELHVRRRI